MKILEFFSILFILSLTSFVRASESCQSNFDWKTTTPGAQVVHLEPENFRQNGALHIELDSNILETLKRESQILAEVSAAGENWKRARFNAVRESFSNIEPQLAEYLLSYLKAKIPYLNWRYSRGHGTGQIQGKIPEGVEHIGRHNEKYEVEWHTDVVPPTSIEAFYNRTLKEHYFRVVVSASPMESPSTLLRLEMGPHKAVVIQAPKGYAVGFMKDFIVHTTPEFSTDARYIYVFDFTGFKPLSPF